MRSWPPTTTSGSCVTDRDGDEALPRFVGTWRAAYVWVLANLALNVFLFWILRRAYQ
jgi:hypothetical protein